MKGHNKKSAVSEEVRRVMEVEKVAPWMAMSAGAQACDVELMKQQAINFGTRVIGDMDRVHYILWQGGWERVPALFSRGSQDEQMRSFFIRPDQWEAHLEQKGSRAYMTDRATQSRGKSFTLLFLRRSKFVWSSVCCRWATLP